MATLDRLRDPVALSSSPAFDTPVHPLLPTQQARPPPPKPAFAQPTISPVIAVRLEAATLRPVAFRTFTKKHNLTLSSSALQALAAFIGKDCGTGWREEGTGEKVLSEAAKLWKAEKGGEIVEDGTRLQGILRTLEGCMVGGRLGAPKTGNKLSRESSFAFGNDSALRLPDSDSSRPSLDSRQDSFGFSKLHVDGEVEEEDEHADANTDLRAWLKVTSAYDQPRSTYDVDKKHFVQLTHKPSLLPPPSRKTAVFRERYNTIHQRLLRNEAFQTPSFSSRSTTLARTDSITTQQFYKLTPIANLLGRGGTSHLLLGMLVIAPTGVLALNDPSGSISLDLQHAQPLQGEDSAYFCPGMIVLVDGVYEEDWAGAGSSGLGNTGGIGGSIGGRFLAFSIGSPPVEKRNVSLGISTNATEVGGGFGWTDFLGLGSERAVGERMRRLERRLLNDHTIPESKKLVVMSEVTLDQPSTLAALHMVLAQYAAAPHPPLAFILLGNFCSQPALAGASTGSIEYKELFNSLAAVLRDYPSLLLHSTWIFVPGDNDPWASAFSAGASTVLPREAVPELLTSRVQRVFIEAGVPREEVAGKVVWTSNPARVSLCGPAQEVLVVRDDVSGRLRRNAVRIGRQVGQQSGGETAVAAADASQEDVVMSGALPTAEDVTDETTPTADRQSLQANVDTTPASIEVYNTAQAKKLILSLLPQSTLSPFPLSIRPTHWDYASSALSLYPLPHMLVSADAEADAFAMTFEGCHVVNPGRLVGGGGKRKRVGWVEYCFEGRRGVVKGYLCGCTLDTFLASTRRHPASSFQSRSHQDIDGPSITTLDVNQNTIQRTLCTPAKPSE
ncbi:DNA-directed DNA polymerase epsilon, subunit B [Friedmanniomyces endolithicus]|nr:DNA-directed DNA polymerase epsilon, subunit B [Friedmanniomyces endolithicus]